MTSDFFISSHVFYSHTFMHTRLLTQVSTSALTTDAHMNTYSLHMLYTLPR